MFALYTMTYFHAGKHKDYYISAISLKEAMYRASVLAHIHRLGTGWILTID